MENNKPTILLVEDEVSNIEFLVNSLQDNYQLKLANNGSVAIKILNKFPIDLVVSDIQMPVMDGYELIQYIMSQEEYSKIPVIFLTALTDHDAILKGFELGARDYVTKPFNEQELVVRVKNHVTSYLRLKKIEEQQRMLIAQSKVAAMGEMTSMLAHQWRQPLNAIAVLLQEIELKQMLGKLSKEEFSEITGQVHNTVIHMSQTIDNFRDFFKSSKNKAYFDIVNAIDKVTDILNIKLKRDYIDFSIEYKKQDDPSYYNFEGYEGEFKQVIVNLVSNAAEAISMNEIKKGKVTIHVIKQENGFIIEVQDNGGGIDNEIIDSIFEPYMSTKLEKNGSGLGLYMSKMIIEKNMDGKLTCENRNGGALFTIQLGAK